MFLRRRIHSLLQQDKASVIDASEWLGAGSDALRTSHQRPAVQRLFVFVLAKHELSQEANARLMRRQALLYGGELVGESGAWLPRQLVLLAAWLRLPASL